MNLTLTNMNLKNQLNIHLVLILTISVVLTIGFTPAYAQFNSWITFDTGVKEVRSLLAEDRIERLKAEVNNTSAQVLNQELRIEMLQAQKDELFKHANDQTIKRGLNDSINETLLDIRLNATEDAIDQLNVLRGAIHCDSNCESTVDTITSNHISTLEDNGRTDIFIVPDAHYVGNPGSILINYNSTHHADYSYNILIKGYPQDSHHVSVSNPSDNYYIPTIENRCVSPNTQNCLLLQIGVNDTATIPEEYEFTFDLVYQLGVGEDSRTTPATEPYFLIDSATFTLTDS